MTGQLTNEIFRLVVNGTSVYDVYGHSITNNMAISGNALVGDGTTKSVIVGNPADFEFGTKDFEIEAEIYRTGTAPSGLGVLVSRASVTTPGGFALLLNANVPTIYLTDSTSNWKTSFGGGTCPLNQWTRCKVTRKGNTISLYVNDVLVNSQQYTFAVGGSSIQVGIGGNSDRSYSIIGQIRNVVIKLFK